MIDLKTRNQLLLIDAQMGITSTDEQKEFAADFKTPLMSFSNPGTGKSQSIIQGLIMAQTYGKVSGSKINAMSFTREATAELQHRYEAACKKCYISPNVKFNTFHAITRRIVLTKYPSMQIRSGFNLEKDIKLLEGYIRKRGFECDDAYFLKKVLYTIDSLNNALQFDPENVKRSYKFKELNMDIELFQQLRKDLFQSWLIQGMITQGSIPMYALYVLANEPEIRRKFRDEYEIMVVDEFQDMTKLYLIILSIISKNLIVIGDIKQQIYGFNGACSDIVQEYMKMYPNARRVDLTQSFRCKDEIAMYATRIYKPNDLNIVPFKGTGEGGSISIVKTTELDVKGIVENIAKEQSVESSENARQTMFLFRNNFSITPIAEELYKQNVHFRVKKFYKVMDLPIYNTLTCLAFIAQEPENMKFHKYLIQIIPELRKYTEEDCPVFKAVKITNERRKAIGNYKQVAIYDLDYAWKQQGSKEILKAIRIANERIKKDMMCSHVFDAFVKVYDEYIIEGKWWKFDQPREYYDQLVMPIIANKTFPQMVAEEYEKANRIEECVRTNIGVKCYTMHSAKGLEADDVYLLDMENEIFPSAKNMKRYCDAECQFEAAKTLREERNLLYVAITRAKDKVVISYSGTLTKLITNPNNNEYSYLDDIYRIEHTDYDDVGYFLKMINAVSKVEELLPCYKIKTNIAQEDDFVGLSAI